MGKGKCQLLEISMIAIICGWSDSQLPHSTHTHTHTHIFPWLQLFVAEVILNYLSPHTHTHISMIAIICGWSDSQLPLSPHTHTHTHTYTLLIFRVSLPFPTSKTRDIHVCCGLIDGIASDRMGLSSHPPTTSQNLWLTWRTTHHST